MADKFVQLKDKDGNNIFPVGKNSSPYPDGCILVTAENTATYTASSDLSPAAIWNIGSWTQYGPMKQSSNAWRAKITVPTGEKWTLKFRFTCSHVIGKAAQASMNIGMGRLTGENATFAEWWGNNNQQMPGTQWACLVYEEIKQFTAGTWYFAPYIFTYKGAEWRTGRSETLTPTTGNGEWAYGPSGCYTIQLVYRENA